MKRVLLFGLVLLVSVVFVSQGLAEEKAKAPEKPAAAAPEKAAVAAPEKAAPEKAMAPGTPIMVKAKKARAKAKVRAGFVGQVTCYDAASKILTVKGKKSTIGFDLADAKFKGYKSAADIKAGDKVVVLYVKDGIKVEKIGGAKALKAKKAKKAKK